MDKFSRFGLALLTGALFASGAAWAEERVMAPENRAYSAHSTDPHRQFDFWVGEWQVDLRMRQEDGSWPKKIKAHTSIYSILGGRAVLELWDSREIKGYSLRYYDPAREKWVLWLNWPGPDRAATSSLEGNFAFGRGDFLSERTDKDGKTLISRYSFNDITPFSLRWDDHYSSDGGKTWSESWIMEFSRLGVQPGWPIDRAAVPTYADGGRCKKSAFHDYDRLDGEWTGHALIGGDSQPASLSGFRILEGCAVMAFITSDQRQWFVFASYNSAREMWETHLLSDDPAEPVLLFQGADGPYQMSGGESGALTWDFNDGLALTWQTGEDSEISASFTRKR